MRSYEVMAIFDVGLDEEAIRATVSRAADLIASRGGSSPHVEHWGRRRLAYELKHRSEGYYVLIRANAEPATMAEVDRMFSLADEVVRHKVIRIPDAVAAKADGPATPAAGATGAGRAGERELT